MVQWLVETQAYLFKSEDRCWAEYCFGEWVELEPDEWPHGDFNADFSQLKAAPVDVTEAHLCMVRWISTQFQWSDHEFFANRLARNLAMHAVASIINCDRERPPVAEFVRLSPVRLPAGGSSSP